MKRQFQFTIDDGHLWTFDVEQTALASCGSPPSPLSATDVAQIVADALRTPVDFPDISQACVPGDRVVVAVDPHLPHPTSVAEGAVRALVDAGIPSVDITILLPPELTALAERLNSAIRDVNVHVHNASDRCDVAYLAATKSGQSVYLSRTACDADLLIPISNVLPPRHPLAMGVFGGLYPAFADAEVVGRFHSCVGLHSLVQHRRRRDETDEVGWLIGAAVVVGVVPGAMGSPLQAIAGTPKSVQKSIEQLQGCDSKVTGDAANLVVALLTDVDRPPTWTDVACALHIANSQVQPGGAVALCGRLPNQMGPSISRLSVGEEFSSLKRELQRDAHPDSWAAMELAIALDIGPVFMASNLVADDAERLGVAPIESEAELTRLCQRMGQCAVVHNAQFAAPAVDLSSNVVKDLVEY